ncbi:hypothetical protein LX36DRAFT_54445 [Colletotrichum falcatum]|nr:hypothetical protein LX36DRAFT_54445 [Colletotrichum falcatum]
MLFPSHHLLSSSQIIFPKSLSPKCLRKLRFGTCRSKSPARLFRLLGHCSSDQPRQAFPMSVCPFSAPRRIARVGRMRSQRPFLHVLMADNQVCLPTFICSIYAGAFPPGGTVPYHHAFMSLATHHEAGQTDVLVYTTVATRPFFFFSQASPHWPAIFTHRVMAQPPPSIGYFLFSAWHSHWAASPDTQHTAPWSYNDPCVSP